MCPTSRFVTALWSPASCSQSLAASEEGSGRLCRCHVWTAQYLISCVCGRPGQSSRTQLTPFLPHYHIEGNRHALLLRGKGIRVGNAHLNIHICEERHNVPRACIAVTAFRPSAPTPHQSCCPHLDQTPNSCLARAPAALQQSLLHADIFSMGPLELFRLRVVRQHMLPDLEEVLQPVTLCSLVTVSIRLLGGCQGCKVCIFGQAE